MSRLCDCVIDISHHNLVDRFWDVYHSGIRAVVHKATQGTKFIDQQLDDRRKRVLDTPMLFGSYHFADGQNPKSQARHYLDHVGPGELLVLDWEDWGGGHGTMVREQAEVFVLEIHEQAKVWPVLYSGSAFLAQHMAGVKAEDTPLSNCPLSLARYPLAWQKWGVKVNWDFIWPDTIKLRPKVPQAWSRWHLWQYTSCGKVPGIVGRVDRQVFKGSEAELAGLWAKCGTKP